MSVTLPRGAVWRWRRCGANIAAALVTLLRPARGGRPVWPSRGRLLAYAAGACAAIAAAMLLLDERVVRAMRLLPAWLVAWFDEITDFGKSGWFLWPLGVLLLALAAIAALDMTRISRLVLAALAVRVGFVFLAIGLPGLVVAILKRLIGRARPLVEDGTLVLMPFIWRPEYASIPSGHGTTAFAAAIAIGAVWPRVRALMWVYALLIAASRVAISAHYLSDVIAGALFGIFGAILVRDWFAARRLGFVVDAAGRVRTLPGPSWRRLKRVARRLLAT